MLSFANDKPKEKGFSFVSSDLLPFILKLGDLVKKGFDHYVQMKIAGVEVDRNMLATFIEIQMGNWNPKVGSKPILDPYTKKSAAQFIAGLAYTMAQNQE